MEKNYNSLFEKMGILAQEASFTLQSSTTLQKNKVLNSIADTLDANIDKIIKANEQDLLNAKENGVRAVMIDRLKLTSERIHSIANGVRQVVLLPDPIGLILEEIERENGLIIKKKSVPIGVALIIYEARPNVTVDAAALCIKSGNTVILRGGKEALETNKILIQLMQLAIQKAGLDKNIIQLVPITDRSAVGILLQQKEYIDVVIPRGSAGLIQRIVKESHIPVIETGAGICHTYIDKDANLAMAKQIVLNAKVQRPSVCNAMETLLINKDVLLATANEIFTELWKNKVSLRLDEKTFEFVKQIWDKYKYVNNVNFNGIEKATDIDWDTEYNDLILSVKSVENIKEAIAHIRMHGTKHSECIVTDNLDAAEYFMNRIDASTVYHNASTRFTDGFEFGYGAEIGISTQKLHARGPMGLKELTSYKYFVYGIGQIRQ